MHVGVITYQVGHLKTWQIVRRLMSRGHQITLFAFPFKLRDEVKTRYEDRPRQIMLDFDVERFCRAHGIGFQKIDGWTDGNASCLDWPNSKSCPAIYLTCIAKIIPASFITGRRILNCHPGLLPHNRGIDAFKWSLVNGWPFGVTLHAIDPVIDRGTILHRMRVPVLPSDTLSDVWKRAYDLEGDLLANFDVWLTNEKKGWFVGDDHPLGHKLVPQEIDARIEELFLDRRAQMVALSCNFNVQSHPADDIYRREMI